MDVGPSTGGEVVSFQELAAWSLLTGHRLTGWEASMLRQMSSAWLAELDAAADPKRPAPFVALTVETIDRPAIASARLEMFKRLAAQQAGEQPERVTKRPPRA